MDASFLWVRGYGLRNALLIAPQYRAVLVLTKAHALGDVSSETSSSSGSSSAYESAVSDDESPSSQHPSAILSPESVDQEQVRRSRRNRRPPGDWWKAPSVNAVHVQSHEKFWSSDRVHIISEEEALEEAIFVADMQRQLMGLCGDTTVACNSVTTTGEGLDPSLLASDIPIPKTVSEALSSPYADYWRDAMKKEIRAIRDRDTFTLVELPRGKRTIGNRFVFDVKSKADGRLDKFKCRLVVQGFSQRPGIDYGETFAPVAHYESQRILMALAVKLGLKVRQADVLNAFLCGEIDVEIFMKQPEGFVDQELSNYVCKLNKGLYGLKQAGNLFNKKLNQSLVDKYGFNRCQSDPCLYYRKCQGRTLILLSLHVDDMTFAHNNDSVMEDVLSKLHDEFGIKDMGSPEKVLGVRVQHDLAASTVTMDQEAYVNDLLKKFSMEQCGTVSTPHQVGYYLSESMCPTTDQDKQEMENVPYRSLVGALLYLSTRTRPDIAYIVGQLCRFMNNPGREHWTAAKRVLRYLKGTASLGLRYSNETDPVVFTDSDWAGDPDQRRSTGGFVFMMGGGPISWSSHRAKSTSALSAVEAEYVAMCRAAREAAWTHEVIRELTGVVRPIPMMVDNQGAASMAGNRRTDARTKHIAVKYHYTRDQVEAGTVTINDIRTKDMIADFLTKPIDGVKFKWCRAAMGMIDVDFRGCVEPNRHRHKDQQRRITAAACAGGATLSPVRAASAVLQRPHAATNTAIQNSDNGLADLD
jgi:Reverse transcriptase (RNA-dependent DNA polymerase)